MRFLVLIAVLAAAGCSSAEPAPTVVTAAPAVIVADVLDAIAVVDNQALEESVEPVGLAVLAGVENQLRSDEMAVLVETGLQGDLLTSYWSSFRDDFEAFRGVPIDSLSVGEERAEDLGADLAAVTVSGTGDDGVVILRRSDELGWQVDMIGTVGPPLVESLGNYLDSALGGANADAIARAYQVGVLPGLEAASALDPTNASVVFGTESIRQMLLDWEASNG